MSRGWKYHLATGASLRQKINDGEETLKSCIIEVPVELEHMNGCVLGACLYEEE